VRRPRRRPPARVAWAEATAAFLLVTDYTLQTRTTYKGHLKQAGRQLGKVPLGRLTAEQLASYRAAVLEGRRGAKVQALGATRVFLLWAAEHGLLDLEPAAIRDLLRPPGAARGAEPMGATTRWRRGERRRSRPPSPAAAPATLAAFGYPPGVAGLALVAEEIHALREALLTADRKRWAELAWRTDHPVNRRPGGGVTTTEALDILRGAGSRRRDGKAAFLSGLGYEGPSGEQRLLGALRELRAAFAEQQRGTLGRTVWRLYWREEAIPLLAWPGGQPA
jgi:hypothetical protein